MTRRQAEQISPDERKCIFEMQPVQRMGMHIKTSFNTHQPRTLLIKLKSRHSIYQGICAATRQ